MVSIAVPTGNLNYPSFSQRYPPYDVMGADVFRCFVFA